MVGSSTNKLENDVSVKVMLEYFHKSKQMINNIIEDNVKLASQEAFYDAIGGYVE